MFADNESTAFVKFTYLFSFICCCFNLSFTLGDSLATLPEENLPALESNANAMPAKTFNPVISARDTDRFSVTICFTLLPVPVTIESGKS